MEVFWNQIYKLKKHQKVGEFLRLSKRLGVTAFRELDLEPNATISKRSVLLSVCLGLWIGIALFSCQKGLVAVPSCNFVQNGSKQRVSWKGRLPIRLRIDRSVPKEAHSSIDKAIQAWNSINANKLFEIVDYSYSGRPNSYSVDKIPTIYWMTEWPESRQREQAKATVHWFDDSIQDADIRINNKYFNFRYFGSDFRTSDVDLTSLLIHELGHTLGMAHIPDERSVMYYQLPRNTVRPVNYTITNSVDLASHGCEYPIDERVWQQSGGDGDAEMASEILEAL